MKPWEFLEDVDEIQAGCRTILRKKYRMGDGSEKIADIVNARGMAAAFVIALTPDNQVIIARQYRCGPDQMLDELPGGLVDPGESVKQAAIREMREEVGYTSDDVVSLGHSYSDAWDHMIRHYFLARNCYEVEHDNPDSGEEIEVAKITIDKLIDNAKNARMIDVVGVFLAQDELLKIKEDRI